MFVAWHYRRHYLKVYFFVFEGDLLKVSATGEPTVDKDICKRYGTHFLGVFFECDRKTVVLSKW